MKIENLPYTNSQCDVWEKVWVLVDPVDCRDRHLSSLDSVLLPASFLNIHLFRHARVSSTYPSMSVRPSVRPSVILSNFYQRLWSLNVRS